VRATEKHRYALQVCAAISIAAVTLTSQASGQTDHPAPVFQDEVSVGYVYVPVVVRSEDGYVRDLKRNDFTLLVDGRPATFDSFETGATAPVSLVVLQDLSGSMANGGKLEASREAVRYLLDHARTGDEFSLAWFAGGVFEIDVPFTTDLGALRAALDSWEAYGKTALQDAVARLPRVLDERHGVKRAALLITDGVDNASSIDADRARELVRQAELPVYVLGLGAAHGEKDKEEAVAEAYRIADMLSLLASMTGGRYHGLADPEGLAAACAEVLDDLRHQYVLGFTVGGSGNAREHRLDVVVSGKGKRAMNFRHGYYGLPPEAPTASTRKKP
jgi:VWFA-related protein